MTHPKPREEWATRIGLILAMAGNAIGLGNFLRFPVQAAQNGGGAFMIPYFLSFVLLGIPLMWAEWTMGRYGGIRGHGTTPGIFDKMWGHPAAKYIGVLGVFLPLGITIYYIYIESWTLGFSFFSAIGKYIGLTTREEMGGFLKSYQGVASGGHFDGITVAYIFFLITIVTNFAILYRGIAKGIELLAKFAMPMLFVFALILVVRVLTLGTPDPAYPDRNVLSGLAFIWNPDFSQLSNGKIWLAAAGQIFFTLSVASGAIHTYASYLREKDDIVITGLTTASTNEFAEVILGGSIAIPVAFAFFGFSGAIDIARGGSFDLGFATMPIIFQKLPLGMIFGTLWFLLLFFAGITSSVALTQPAIAFFQDELGWTRKQAVIVVMSIVFVCGHFVIFGLKGGFLDEMDFWVGTFGLALFALVETLIFVFLFKNSEMEKFVRTTGIRDAIQPKLLFGMQSAWNELHKGAQVNVPGIFFYILKYVTPVFLLILFLAWTIQDGLAVLTMKGVAPEDAPWRWGARILLVALIAFFAVLVGYAWKKNERGKHE